MKKKKLNLKNLIYDNRFVLALSIVAAVIIWIVVAIQATPEDDRIIKDVPVKIEISNNVSNLGLQTFGDTDFTVDVKVHGKRYEVAESVLTKDDIVAVAKTNYVDSAGSKTLKVEVTAKDPDKANYDIVSWSSSTVTVYFDYYKEGEYTLQTDLKYDDTSYVPNGYFADTPVLSVNTVKLSGPVTEMEQIDRVVARVKLDKKISTTTTFDAEVIALSEYGGKLQYITVNDGIDDITMTLPVYKRATMPTTVTFKNAPSAYSGNPPSFTCSPSKLDFMMDETSLANMTELSVAEIDFYRLGAGRNEIKIDLTTLKGVKVLGDAKVLTVTVNMTGVTSKKSTVSANNITFSNVPTGYKAVVTQSKISSVEVVGPKDDLENITSEQLFAEVDLSSADVSSSHGTAYARAYVKDSGTCWVHNRYEVSYRLEKVQ